MHLIRVRTEGSVQGGCWDEAVADDVNKADSAESAFTLKSTHSKIALETMISKMSINF